MISLFQIKRKFYQMEFKKTKRLKSKLVNGWRSSAPRSQTGNELVQVTAGGQARTDGAAPPPPPHLLNKMEAARGKWPPWGGEETPLEPERSEGFMNDLRATSLNVTNMEAKMAALTWIRPGCVWRSSHRQITNFLIFNESQSSEVSRNMEVHTQGPSHATENHRLSWSSAPESNQQHVSKRTEPPNEEVRPAQSRPDLLAVTTFSFSLEFTSEP